jgi:hypothetical protein
MKFKFNLNFGPWYPIFKLKFKYIIYYGTSATTADAGYDQCNQYPKPKDYSIAESSNPVKQQSIGSIQSRYSRNWNECKGSIPRQLK